jgi:hypothetical protein
MRYLWDERARELRESVVRAHKAYMRAANDSKSIMNDLPSDLPIPDGTQRIANAGKAERHALDEYVKAMREFNDYVNQKPKTPCM